MTDAITLESLVDRDRDHDCEGFGAAKVCVKVVGVAGALVLAACSGKDSAMTSDLQKDLERASTASEITLPASQPASQVVSAIERTQPAVKRVAQSQRAPKHRPARRAIPAPVAKITITVTVTVTVMVTSGFHHGRVLTALT